MKLALFRHDCLPGLAPVMHQLCIHEAKSMLDMILIILLQIFPFYKPVSPTYMTYRIPNGIFLSLAELPEGLPSTNFFFFFFFTFNF